MWKFFEKTNEKHTTKTGKATMYYKVICIACKDHHRQSEEVDSDALQLIVGRSDCMIPHIKSCKLISREARDSFVDGMNSNNTSSSTPSTSKASNSSRGKDNDQSLELVATQIYDRFGIGRNIFEEIVDAILSSEHVSANNAKKRKFNNSGGLNGWVIPGLESNEIKKLENSLLILIADAALPFSIVERQSFIDVVNILRPHPENYLPSRRMLSGTILNSLAEEAYRDMFTIFNNLTKQHAFTSLLVDGWKSINDDHILGSSLLVLGNCVMFENEKDGSEHDGLSVARSMEKLIEAARNTPNLNIKLGSITTDDCPSVARGRRILALRYTELIFQPCWAHQLNLIMKHLLRRSTFATVIEEACTALAYISKSSSKYLVKAKASMRRFYGKDWALLTVCDTRWNSLQMSLASLLRVRGALRSFAVEEVDVPSALQPLSERDFWSRIVIVESILRPVAALSFILERSDTTLAHVMHALGILYQEISQVSNKHHIPDIVIDLEKRWLIQEQPIYLLAYLVHPTFTTTALTMIDKFKSKYSVYSTHLSEASLATVAQAYFDKWFPDYVAGEQEQTIEYTMFQFLTKEDARKNIFPKGAWDRSTSWTYHSVYDFIYSKGYQAFALFAMKILSVSGQSASQERIFKQFKRQQTPVRNRMSNKTMEKLTMVKASLQKKAEPQKSTNRLYCPVEKPRITNVHCDEVEEVIMIGEVVVEQDDSIDEEILEEGNIVIFWQSALATLCPEHDDDDVDLQSTLGNMLPACYDSKDCFDPSHSDTVMNAIASPLPEENIPTYPQEIIKELNNFRAAKFPLQDLFNGIDLFPLIKYELKH